MIRDRIIVCVASSWDYDPTSKHHIMSALSEHNAVLWVNYHGTRRPEANWSDGVAAWSTIRRVARGTQRVHGTMTQCTPLVIPGAGRGLSSKMNAWMVPAQIRRALRSVPGYGTKRLQVWSFAPDVPYLIGRFQEECFVYYCVDEYREFENVDRERIAAAEEEMLRGADVVVTSSEALWESKRARRFGASLVRHGVDFDHFAAAWRDRLDFPEDIAALPTPRLGFFGLIHHWLDLSLLSQVACLRPQYSFVLIGECKVDVSELKRCPNIMLLGRRPYKTLPNYCAAFDAGLLPFKRSAMTRNINPIKMYEYLAAGLPVASTSLPEAERFRGPIRFGDTPEAFATACDEALAFVSRSGREEVSRYVTNESWATKVEQLSELVESCVSVA